MIYCKPLFLGSGARAPVYKTKEAACADLSLPEDVILKPGEVACIDLQIGFDIPAGFKIVMYPRSSLLVKKGIVQPTSIIDADYRGMPVHAPLYNTTNKPIKLKAGERIAQIEVQRVEHVADWPLEVAERTGGFGSTGEGK